ncbi:hypothetical protein [Streptosporangium sp. 'caverna']|uniref:hypothetical protein n=1 Tax=Streptosporangium sp. 'caverna' TaxID=2202249 RepID=UPI000D7DBAF2|nr:hypothetical protein [Streptosporangium sp. 'caverna']AWS46072.1 hypothetical protein DKM19_37010 [Streptosporangium sp. 'caverna']
MLTEKSGEPVASNDLGAEVGGGGSTRGGGARSHVIADGGGIPPGMNLTGGASPGSGIHRWTV